MDAQRLTDAFVAAHPKAAARVLADYAPATAAEVVAALPLRHASPLVAAMLPRDAAACLCAMAESSAAALLQRLDPPQGAAALRPMPDPDRDRLIRQLSTLRRGTLRLLLSYPADAVGAWMTPDPPSFHGELTVAATLQRCRRESLAPMDRLYVVDSDNRLQGSVPVGELLRAQPELTLARLARSAPATLAPRSRIEQVLSGPQWQTSLSLPVVDNAHRLLGFLDRHVVLNLPDTQANRAQAADVRGWSDLLSAYTITLGALMELLLGRVARDRRSR